MIKIIKIENNYRYTRLNILVENVSFLMQYWTCLRVYKADTEDGAYAPLDDENMVPLSLDTELYTYTDTSLPTQDKWYKVCLNNGAGANGEESEPMKSGTELDKIGFTFGNYKPPPGEWGKLLTADDIRYTFMWGIDCTASDVAETNFEDSQFDYFVNEALADFEKELTLDIRKRIYKTDPDDSLVRSKYWREGVEYTDEEMPYAHDPLEWQNFGFIRLRHLPVISIEAAKLLSPVQSEVIDLLDSGWVRLNKKTGQVHLYPTGGQPYGPFVAGVLPWRHFAGRFPQAFVFDYTTGFDTAEFVPEDLRSIIAKWATVKALETVGDGILSGFSSQSVGLDVLSESFSSTQSASIAGETLVEGFGKIEDMYRDPAQYIGKSVMSYNGEEFEKRTILDVVQHDCREKRCFEISTQFSSIIVTEDHSLFDENGAEIKGSDIRIGTLLLMRHGPAPVTEIKETKRDWMYDLSVAVNENFIANWFVCHNTSAYFGARVKSYLTQIEDYLKRNRYKYSVPMSFVGY